MGTIESFSFSWGRDVKCGRPVVVCSIVVTVLVVLLYNVSCNVQDIDSNIKYCNRTYQRMTSVAFHLLSLALGCPNTPLSMICC